MVTSLEATEKAEHTWAPLSEACSSLWGAVLSQELNWESRRHLSVLRAQPFPVSVASSGSLAGFLAPQLHGSEVQEAPTASLWSPLLTWQQEPRGRPSWDPKEA